MKVGDLLFYSRKSVFATYTNIGVIWRIRPYSARPNERVVDIFWALEYGDTGNKPDYFESTIKLHTLKFTPNDYFEVIDS